METVQEIREVKTIITHKAEQLQGVGNQWAAEMDTNEVEEDYLGKCHELLDKLNWAETRLLENVVRLAEKEEIGEVEERERVEDLMKKI